MIVALQGIQHSRLAKRRVGVGKVCLCVLSLRAHAARVTGNKKKEMRPSPCNLSSQTTDLNRAVSNSRRPASINPQLMHLTPALPLTLFFYVLPAVLY